MPVIFQNPPTGTLNPFTDFQPGNRHHYPNCVSGVYIWGLKMIIGGVVKFVPIYVGIAVDLGARLWTHYCNNRSGGNWNWYVFEYASVANVVDVRNLYASIQMSDTSPRKGSHRITLHPPNKLIWYNDKDFFDTKLGLGPPSPAFSKYYPHSGVLSSILDNGDLDSIVKKDSTKKGNCDALKRSIEDAKKLFDDNFYFLYYSMDLNAKNPWIDNKKKEVVKQMARDIEGATKKKLAEWGIHTGSDSKKNDVGNFDIDFRCIAGDLVHVSSLPYPALLVL
jgi:hypothetical protein